MKHMLSFLIILTFSLLAKDVPIKTILETYNFSQQDIENRGRAETKAFVTSKVWAGGYYEGDPTDKNCSSSYHHKMLFEGQYVDPLYACYVTCLRSYVTNKDVLEIGPGRGAWTKAMLGEHPKSIVCVDALPAQYNNFWTHVGRNHAVKYFQIFDFSLAVIPDDSIDFVFSFGVFCHISPVCIYDYFRNLFNKMRVGAEGFIMYADYDKRDTFARKYNYILHDVETKEDDVTILYTQPTPRWYHMGIGRMEETLLELGYEVVSADININERDPIVHFRKK